MSYGGHLIFETHDTFGEIRVIEQGEKRILSFGPGNEQSAGIKGAPETVVFAYTQAMLMTLLYVPEPRRALLLGLGAGSLASCLHTHYKGCRIEAVELRQAVIDTAYAYFGLPRSKRLQVSCGEASAYLSQVTRKQDLIFSDLYLAEGMDKRQQTRDYLRTCASHLKSTGVFVMNCWREHQQDQEVLELLKENFAHLQTCATHDHNWLIFASNQPLHIMPTHKEQAKTLAKTLGFSLLKHIKRLEEA